MQGKEEGAGILSYFKPDDVALRKLDQKDLKGLIRKQYKAQHACACCCRGCLNKWYRVPIGIELNEVQQKKIVNLLMTWIERQTEKMRSR